MKCGNSSAAKRFLGFSLVEAMVGMLVFGICCIALYTALAGGFSLMRFAREDLQATQIMVDKMEQMRLYSWDQLTDNKMIPSQFRFEYATGNESDGPSGKGLKGMTYKGKVTIKDPPLTANYSSKMKQIIVRVTWESQGGEREREISTMVAKNGLYRFVN
jgi:Tfp pilus assembly protein PilV